MTATIAAMEGTALRTGDTFFRTPIIRWRPLVRQIVAVITGGMICAACGSDAPPEGQVGHLSEDFGGIVSGEPRSALIGRGVLSAGGTAADAIVATYFALSVTYPGAASIGGGGVCVVHRGGDGDIAALDFRPAMFEKGGRAAMIPGAIRGMFALHARFGRLKWEGLLLPAERMARFGNPVSRAFVRKLADVPGEAFSDPGVRRLFQPQGKLLNEGQTLKQLQLSTSLAQIRLRGAGDFYAGNFARKLSVDLGRAVGIEIPVSAFRAYKPVWSDTQPIDVGKDQLHFPGGTIGAEAMALWKATADGVPGKPVQSSRADSIGFAAVDSEGGGAACVVSTNGTLGGGKLIGTSGILMAAPPPTNGAFSGVPALLINKPLADARGALTGAGGAKALSRAVKVGGRVFLDDLQLDGAFGAASEAGDSRVNLIRCPKGSREEPALCRFAVDPAGHGLAVSATF